MTPGEGSAWVAFINSEMWIFPSTNSNEWIETGLTNGGITTGGVTAPPCYCVFGARKNNGAYAEYAFSYLSPGDPDQTQQISRGPSVNFWRIYVNDTPVWLANMGWWENSGVDVGSELHSIDNDARAKTFAMAMTLVNLSGQLVGFTFNGHYTPLDCSPSFTGCFNWTTHTTIFGVPVLNWNKTRG